MSSIGETLRRERQRRNLDLNQISRELKISSKFLAAIEDERFDKLPAGVFAKSFVRQYAMLLGLDADELAAEVQRTLHPEPPPGAPVSEAPRHSLGSVSEIHIPRVEEWETVGDRRNWSSSLPAFALVVVVMLVCSGLYAFWQRSRHPAPVAQEAPPAVEAARPAVQPPAQAQQAPPTAPSTTPETPPAPAPGTGDLAAARPSAAAPASAPGPATATPGMPAATATAQQAPVLTAGTANRTDPNAAGASLAAKGPVHVEITAVEPVWVLARADGKYLFSGTLDANQTRAVDASGTLLLRVGNAGGLSIRLNGKPIGAVGPKGQVRDVQFTSGGFQIVAAPKPPSPPPADPL